MKKSVKKSIISITAAFFVIITLVAIAFQINLMANNNDYEVRQQILSLNEIEKLTEIDGVSPAQSQIRQFEQSLTDSKTNSNYNQSVIILWTIYGISVVFLLVVFAYVYVKIIRPFDVLNDYASEVAKGNLDLPLDYKRTNFFGAFTWAFDHMRREIIKARSCEKEAINNNKTVIATLSHDIKTPIASIRAYSEALQANMDSNAERRERYLSVIMRKCDEVTALTNDLFLHSLSDLDKLQIKKEKIAIKPLIEKTVNEMSVECSDLKISGNVFSAELEVDRNRFVQVLENIINNAKKYAPDTPVRLWTEKSGKNYEIHIKDGGKGIPDEDMPFVLEKFYRGKNVGNNQGSGLGLYIVNYVMKQMNGEISLENKNDGLEVILKFICNS
ncbi:MAG: HAMP domain-containing sensor histidine kinase [Clostridia bacterium]|nr:HAMP domain-containing sensor histidine kinase [Clostridia bacterium]